MSVLNVLRFVATHPLNRNQKLKSFVRFAKWQIGSRLLPGEIVFDWVNGAKFLVRTGDTGLTGNIYAGLHEFSDMAFLLHVLRDDDLFVDIGANVGSYTILACSVVGAKGYAFEPVPITYERLVENIRLNHLEAKVRHFNIGISHTQGEIAFTCDLDTTNHALADGEKSRKVVKVKVSTLDMILRDEAPTLMKIDVEGYELPVLEGALEILKQRSLHSIIIELNGSSEHYGFDETRIVRILHNYGFSAYSYDPFERRLTKLQGKNLSSENTLFIRNQPMVLEKLKNAPSFTIHDRRF